MNEELMALQNRVASQEAELKSLREELAMVGWDVEGILSKLDLPSHRTGEKWPHFVRIMASCIRLMDEDSPVGGPQMLIEHREGKPGLEFIDGKGKVRGELILTETGVGLMVRNAEGKTVVSVGESDDAVPHVALSHADGTVAMGMQVKGGGPMVTLVNAKNHGVAFLGIGEEGGELMLAGRNEQPAVKLKGTDAGGVVTVHEPGGQVMGAITATVDMGMLTVWGPHGEVASTLGAGEEGGVLFFFDADGASRESLP